MRLSFVGACLVLLAGGVLCCERSSGLITATHAGPSLTPSQTIATNASVRLAPVEVGCWLLDTPQGSFLPTNLPSQYRVQGLAVYVVVRGDTGVMSTCMMGPMVSLDSIRAGWL
jgi:hypothetical protein